ncbi:MAG: septum formation initiator family protein [Cocleimonas sp.]
MKALLLIFSTLLILLIAGLWVGSGSYPERWKTEDRINAQEARNNERKDDIDSIKADLEDVASGDGAIEERARSELGMTKENESFFEIILRPENTKAPLSEDLVEGRDLGNPRLKSGQLLNIKAPRASGTKKRDVKESSTKNTSSTVDEINEAENKKIDSEIEKNNKLDSGKVKKK